jgi:hypothetical protein
MNLQIQFPAHTQESTQDGTEQVQENHLKFSNDCKKLMQFWQSKWYWLSNEDGRTFGISSYLSARVWDLVKLGVQIEKLREGNITRFRLKCNCKHIGGVLNNKNCYVHDQTLKIQ